MEEDSGHAEEEGARWEGKRKAVRSGPQAAEGSLAEALAMLPEPRRPYGWSPGRSPLPLVGILQVALAATLCGARSLYPIAQWGRERGEDRHRGRVLHHQPAAGAGRFRHPP